GRVAELEQRDRRPRRDERAELDEDLRDLAGERARHFLALVRLQQRLGELRFGLDDLEIVGLELLASLLDLLELLDRELEELLAVLILRRADLEEPLARLLDLDGGRVMLREEPLERADDLLVRFDLLVAAGDQ